MDSTALTRFGIEPIESLFDSVGLVPNWSPNRFEGWFESTSYSTYRFGELISTRVEFKNTAWDLLIYLA
jgi:hypothetical protein